MIRLLGKVPREITVAVSGGVDSMVLMDFLSRNHRVQPAFYHHGTENSDRALEFLRDYCLQSGHKLAVGTNKDRKPKGLSPEEWWRIQRYEFLGKFDCVVTAHTLDDAVETWIWSSLHGCSSLMPYRRGNVTRPFMLNRKYDLLKWAKDKGVPWCEDTSNTDIKYTRNYIRHQLMPGVLRVNPGIHTTIKKKLVERGIDN